MTGKPAAADVGVRGLALMVLISLRLPGQTFRVFHRIVMDAILRESRRQAGGEPALDAARGLLEYADLATTYASDAYLRRNSCCSRTTTGSAGTCSKTCSPAGSRTAGAAWPPRTRPA